MEKMKRMKSDTETRRGGAMRSGGTREDEVGNLKARRKRNEEVDTWSRSTIGMS